ncbi:MAG: hypothetical protein NAOJABEB_03336 [Steroidobacteraceae bacterium]|nr:hypothetical protein [Steroidobacteraceae bacterium]
MATTLRAPFPWFGGKGRLAGVVWDRLGDVSSYVEPFAGSAAVLLARPDSHQWWDRLETINDLDGFVANFWRAVQHDPEQVAHYADWPVNENDLHARHIWLVGQQASLAPMLEGDPEWYDARIAGWWVWGICAWIGSGWCSGEGPWVVDGGLLVKGDAGQGINRQMPHLGNDAGHCEAWSDHLVGTMQRLADRLRRVRVCSGDWSRVCTPVVVQASRRGPYGVFLDPPYSHIGRDTDLYNHESATVAEEVREWAVANGDNPEYRIALCGFSGEHDMPSDWTPQWWRRGGGFGSQSGRAKRRDEVVWFSPACLAGADVVQAALVAD